MSGEDAPTLPGEGLQKRVRNYVASETPGSPLEVIAQLAEYGAGPEHREYIQAVLAGESVSHAADSPPDADTTDVVEMSSAREGPPTPIKDDVRESGDGTTDTDNARNTDGSATKESSSNQHHENLIDVNDVTDAKRAAMLREYLKAYVAEFDQVPRLMPLDEAGKAPVIQDECPLDSPEGRAYLVDGEEAIRQIREEGARGFAIYAVVKIGHDVDTAILNTIDEYDSEAVLMGWKGQHKTQRRDIVLGSNVDTVVQEASSDVLVEKIGPEAGGADDILVPIAGGPHAELAADIADSIAYTEGGHVDIVNVVEPDASDSARREAQSLLDEAVDRFDATGRDAITTTILEGDDIVDTLVSTSEDYDVTVIGATREGLLQQFVFGAIPEEFARRANVTTVMTKRNMGVTSRLKRLFG